MAHIHLVIGSTLGAAEYVAEHLAEQLTAQGHTTESHNPARLDELALKAEDIILVVTSTHGAGEIPDNLQPFAAELAERKPDLGAYRFAVVALGDSNYDTFCAGGKQMEQLLLDCGSQEMGDRFDIDVTSHDIPEDAADIWLSSWLPKLST
jgi:Flavodoxins